MPATPPKKPPQKELSNEIRMVLAFVLMGLILVATPWVYRKLGLAPPEETKKTAATTAAKKPEAAPSAAGSTAGGTPMKQASLPAAEPTPASSAAEDAVSAASAQTYTIDTSLYHVVFSNRGAVIRSWTLKNYKDAAGKPLELVNEKGDEKVGYPFELTFRDKQPSADLNKALWVAQPSAETISFEYSDGSTHAAKTFAFARDSYMVQYADEVTAVGGAGLPHLVEWRGGFGDMAVQNPSGQQHTIHYDLEKNKLVRSAAKSAKNGPVTADGTFSFAGIDDQYFAAAFLPPLNSTLETTAFDDVVSTPSATPKIPIPASRSAAPRAISSAFSSVPRNSTSSTRSTPSSTASSSGAGSESSRSRSSSSSTISTTA